MANKFKSANSVKTGKKFRDKRVQMDLSFDRIAEIIYVNKNYLIAIEKGEYSIFPSESFAKAYFKKYAKYLHIDCEFPSVFEKEIKAKNKKTSTKIMFNTFRNMQFPSTNRLNIWMVSGLTFLLIIIIYFFSKNISNKEESVLNENSNEYLEINEYQEDITTQNEENYDFMEDSELQKNDFITLSNVLDISADIPPNINSEEKNMLVLEFIDECWVEVYIEGALIEAQFFKNGDEYSKNINSPFSIVVGNADSVKGTYNTQDIDFITNANRLTRVNTINFLND